MQIIHPPQLNSLIKNAQIIVSSEKKALLLYERDDTRSWTYFNPYTGEVLVSE